MTLPPLPKPHLLLFDDALQSPIDGWTRSQVHAYARAAVEAALAAQPQAEPVAWRHKTEENPGKWHLSHMTPAEAREWNCITESQPLFAAPPAAQPTGWIACAERMPPEGVAVIGWDAGMDVARAWVWNKPNGPYTDAHDAATRPRLITHWMPAPPPPAPERAE